ncbi:MAG TPA: HAMP domain-containing sensor histidine kinase [Myxococcota bacterium]|nr:HAMP domain-containing sensor histidine kinase [Myxococcota bacterium]
MRTTLWVRIALLCAGLVVVGAGTAGAYSAWRQAAAMRAAFEERGTTLARSLALRGAEALAAGDRARLANVLDVWEEDEVVEAAFLDGEGQVVAARTRAAPAPGPPAAGSPAPFVCTYPVNLPPRGPDGFEETIGLARVAVSTARLDDEVGRLARTALGIVALVAVLGAAGAVALARVVTRPLGRLVDATRRVGGGDLAASVHAEGGPEVEALAASFNEMVAALARLERTKETLTRMIVHDLRSPATSLLSGLDLIDRSRLEAVDLEVLAAVRARARALLGMIGDLLDARRLEEGKMPVQAERLDAARLAGEVARDVALEAREIGTEVRVEAAAGVPAVLADGALLRRVLENLVSNALRHHPSGGGAETPVRVVVDRGSDTDVDCSAGGGGNGNGNGNGGGGGADGRVRIAVKDAGPGIPEAERARVFEMFVRGADAGARGGASHAARRGAGVGLAFCKLAVEAMGGTIGVAAVGAEGGATLEVRLRAAPEEPSE